MPAILSVMGTIAAASIPILLTSYSSHISNKPDVSVNVIPNADRDGRKALILVVNDGSSAATNMSLTIEANKKIISITNEFTSTSVTISGFNKTLFAMHTSRNINQPSIILNIARFVPGSGSIIKLVTFIDAKQDQFYYNYNVSAAYDQGSVMGKVLKPTSHTLFQYLSNIAEYVVENPFLVASEIAVIPVTWIVLRWWLIKRIHSRSRLIYLLINQLLYSREILKNNIDSEDHFSFGTPNFYSYALRYFEVDDLIRLQDLQTKLDNRIKYLSSPVSPKRLETEAELSKYNKDCLILIEDVLKNIDWTKYRK
jgi:hypothetical protein